MTDCCEIPASYSEKWGAHYCGGCLTWLRARCIKRKPDDANDVRIYRNDECRYRCWERPERPVKGKE